MACEPSTGGFDAAHALHVWVAGSGKAFGVPSAPRFKSTRTHGTVTAGGHARGDGFAKPEAPAPSKDAGSNTTQHSVSRKVQVLQRLELASKSTIAAMAAGAEHAVICCADKTIWSTGSNLFGQLGTGAHGTNQIIFTPLDVRLPIVSVSCGKAHTIVATLYGEMYSCGNNTAGQLGLGDYESRPVLTRSGLSDSSVISVVAGDNYALAVTRRGQLFSFGNNCEGQLGISRLQDKDNRTFADRIDHLASTPTPTLVQFEPELAAARHPVAFDVLQISCGSRHCVAIVRTWRVDTHEVISDRELYSWGSNRYGQLGKSMECQYQGTPRWVQIHPAQHRTRLPDDFPQFPAKARHDDPSTMLWYESSGFSDDALERPISQEDSVNSEGSSEWMWGGYGEKPVQKPKGQGEGFRKMNAKSIKYEAAIAISKVPVRVACGSEFSLVVTADGCLYAFGCCEKGQLGVRGMKNRVTPTLVSALHGKKVTGVACGREHAFALTEGGDKVYGWGCNAQGQLGLPATDVVELPQLLDGVVLRTNRDMEKRDAMPLDSDVDELASIERCFPAVIAGGDFSLLGHIDVNGFPKEDPASNLRYNIPGDVLICTLGTAIPRYVPYIEGTPPFVYSAHPPLPDGLHLNEANGQLCGAPITSVTSADAKLQQFRIMAHNKCCPDVTSTYLLRVRITDAQHVIDMKEAHRDKGAVVSKE